MTQAEVLKGKSYGEVFIEGFTAFNVLSSKNDLYIVLGQRIYRLFCDWSDEEGVIVDPSDMLARSPPFLEDLNEKVAYERVPLYLGMVAEVKFLYQSLARPHMLYRDVMLIVQPFVRDMCQSVGRQLLRDLLHRQNLLYVPNITSLAGLVDSIGLRAESSAVVELQRILGSSVGA